MSRRTSSLTRAPAQQWEPDSLPDARNVILPELIGGLLREIIRRSSGRTLKIMEVCGGHTHAIYKHGLEDLLPPSIDLVHGPGCPVCVIPMGRIDDALAIAAQPDVIFTTSMPAAVAARSSTVLSFGPIGLSRIFPARPDWSITLI